jgi:hypothetical protein
MVPAIGWILSANEIKLVTPAIMSESRHTVISTASTTIIFLALEFWAAAAAFTIRCLYCAPGTAGFNRNMEKRRADFPRIIASLSQRLRVLVRSTSSERCKACPEQKSCPEPSRMGECVDNIFGYDWERKRVLAMIEPRRGRCVKVASRNPRRPSPPTRLCR